MLDTEAGLVELALMAAPTAVKATVLQHACNTHGAVLEVMRRQELRNRPGY